MNEEIKNSIKEEQIVVDTVWAYNEYAKPVVDWTSARWMDCYELSAGWTIGVSIVLGLWILGKILPDSDGESAPAPRRARAAAPAAAPTSAAPAGKKTTWYYALTLANPSEPRKAAVICPNGSVKATSYSEAMNMVYNRWSTKLNSRNQQMVIAEVSTRVVRQITHRENC